jgi:hypothetical protein
VHVEVARERVAREDVVQATELEGHVARHALAQLDAGQAVNLFGYHLTPAQHRALREVDITKTLSNKGPPTLLVDVVRAAGARESKELQSLAAALGDRVRRARAVEPYPLYAESKVRVMRADEVCSAVLTFFEG